jgi:hypothetical protein
MNLDPKTVDTISITKITESTGMFITVTIATLPHWI